jgi:hypothetical protein
MDLYVRTASCGLRQVEIVGENFVKIGEDLGAGRLRVKMFPLI